MTFDQMRTYLLNVERIVFFLLVSVAVMGSLVLAHDWSVHPWLPDCADTRPMQMTIVFTVIYGVMLLRSLRGRSRAFYVFGLVALASAGATLLLSRVVPVAPPMQALTIVVWSFAATGVDRTVQRVRELVADQSQ